MLTRKKKESIVSEIKSLLERSKFLIFTDPTSLNSEKNFQLRRELKKIDHGEYHLVKKNLLERAMNELGMASLPEGFFKTSVAVLFISEPNVDAAKLFYKFSRENEKFALLGGWLERNPLTQQQIIQFAKLPSKEVLLSQLLSVIQAPLRNLAMVLQGNNQKLVTVLAAIAKTK